MQKKPSLPRSRAFVGAGLLCGAGLMGGLLPSAVVSSAALAAEPALKLGQSAEAKPAAEVQSTEAKPTVPSIEPGVKPIALPVDAANVGPDVLWNDHFAGHNESPAAIREAVRKLFEAKKFDHVIALTQAALRHGQGQPWMHEVLGLALQAHGAPAADIERTLLSAVDLQEPNPVNLMYVAKFLARQGSEGRALQLYRQASLMSPTRPEPYEAALSLAERVRDVDALRWACVGVLKQAWVSDKTSLFEHARGAAAAVVQGLKAEGKTAEAVAFHKEIDDAMRRDVVVVVSWTGEADVDMIVEEPSGTICSHRQDRTTAGGVLLKDESSQQGQRSSKLTSETYLCPEGFEGKYRVKLRRVWGQVTANRVWVDVYTNVGSPKAKHERREISLRNDEDVAVVFGLADGRREEHLAQHMAANAADQQVAFRRDLLMQQIDQSSSGDALADLVRNRQSLFSSLGLPFQGAVGFQPVIIVLSEGATLSAQAVISADRRYVRFTGIPMFTGIGDVTTYNIGSGASTSSPFQGGGGLQGGGGGAGAGNN